ncbi:MAG: beta-agarase [Terriglobia bacterium]
MSTAWKGGVALAGLCLVLSLTPAAGAQSRYFRVEQRNGAWWFTDSGGRTTISIGVDAITYDGDRTVGGGPSPYLETVEKAYPSRGAWDRTAIERLRKWGFNSIGAWSDPELWKLGMPYTVILNIAARAGADWQHGKPVDVYDPRFEEAAREISQRLCAPRSRDAELIGYFSDNELRWGPDWRGKETMLAMYLNLPTRAPGRRQAVAFLRQRYHGDVRALDTAWHATARDFAHAPPMSETDAYKSDANEFLRKVADRYFEVCASAIHAADPNHLYLGARFAGNVPDPVFRAARAADVISINIYQRDPRPLVARVFGLTDKPVLITEFAFRAEDSGLPNTKGAGPKVANEAARALAYRDYVIRLESLPEAVGYHWFKWADEPKAGRFDGENSNYGLVNVGDKPYGAFDARVKAANRAAVATHRNSGSAQ